MTWVEKTFDALTTAELYALLHLRSEVFVVEQNCPYLDMDYADQQAVHVMGYNEAGKLVAYTRLFGPGIKYDMAAIGRVVTAKEVRGGGIGRALMAQSIALLEARFGKQPIKIGAQQYLLEFYSSFGFRQSSDMYLEDNIPHIEMIRP